MSKINKTKQNKKKTHQKERVSVWAQETVLGLRSEQQERN